MHQINRVSRRHTGAKGHACGLQTGAIVFDLNVPVISFGSPPRMCECVLSRVYALHCLELCPHFGGFLFAPTAGAARVYTCIVCRARVWPRTGMSKPDQEQVGRMCKRLIDLGYVSRCAVVVHDQLAVHTPWPPATNIKHVKLGTAHLLHVRAGLGSRRVDYMRSKGFDAWLQVYTSKELSPENVCLVAKRSVVE